MRLYLILISLITMIAVGCSKSPKQSGVATPLSEVLPSQQGANNFNNKAVPNLVTEQSFVNKATPGGDQIGGASSDDFVKANSLKPIVFGEGAGGITFKTTLEESYSLLSRPDNPPDVYGRVIYKEGLYVRWRDDDPRTPLFIWVENEYQGQLLDSEGNPWIGMNHNFGLDYPTNPSGADQLAKDIYARYVDVEKDFDCLSKGFCNVNWGPTAQKLFVVSIPAFGMNFVLSKDRFIVFRIAMEKNVPLGLLDNNLDILSGAFMAGNNRAIKLGDKYREVETLQNETYKSIEEQTGKPVEIETEIETSLYRRMYGSTYLGYHRTDFDRKAVTAKPTDELSTILLRDNFTKLLTIDGDPVLIKEFADHVELSVVGEEDSEAQVPAVTSEDLTAVQGLNEEPLRELSLQLNMGLSRGNVLDFAEKLSVLVKNKLQEQMPKALIYAKTSGYFQKNTIKTYTSDVVAYDPVENTGLHIQYATSEENGHIIGFYINRLGKNSDLYDQLIVPAALTPVTKTSLTYTQLAGFSLGQKIALKDWDIGRAEATMEMTANTGIIRARVPFYERDSEEVAYSTYKVDHRPISSVAVGSLGVSLGLVELSSQSEKERQFAIVSITSGANVSFVENLCDGAIVPKFGMSAIEFLDLLKSTSCENRIEFVDNGNGNLDSVYFPNEQLRVNFDDQELKTVTIYIHEGGVQ